MSSELQKLYQRTVLEHCRSPRNFHAMDEPDRVAAGFNPLCGDKVTVYLRTPGSEGVPPSVEDGTSSLPGVIAEISFEAAGCAICLASASMMTELLGGEAAEEARQQAEKVLEAFKPGAQNGLGELGEIVALGSVRSYPSRIRCVTLPWKTFTAALDGDPNTVSTE
ncbi:MAG: SUF system NifU family Fe-S cluster assembly protein [Gammaproteobacteria bacterium]|nr:SUF system NifU family Fe-S cluster assembly protein [Gammaproteobacteria bacterium]